MTRFHWGLALLGSFLAVLIGVSSSIGTNYRDWHPEAFSGWTLWGFVLLVIGIVILTVVAVMSFTGDAVWTTWVALVIGIAVGVGTVLYLQNVDVKWSDVLLGLLCFGTITLLVLAIGYLCGRQHLNGVEPTEPT